jgi:hypothetical protein
VEADLEVVGLAVEDSVVAVASVVSAAAVSEEVALEDDGDSKFWLFVNFN